MSPSTNLTYANSNSPIRHTALHRIADRQRGLKHKLRERKSNDVANNDFTDVEAANSVMQ